MKATGKHPDKKLTALKVNQATKPGRYADGNGLYLVVEPSGAKRWLLRLVVNGRRRDMGLGSARLVPLAEARELALANRKLAREGGDPIAARAAERKVVPTFKEAAEKVHAEHKAGWKNEKHAQQWLNTLTEYAFPLIGDLRVNAIATPDILKVLTPIWLTKPETARRVRQRMGTVLDWAKTAGYRVGDNPIAGVQKGLPKQGRGDDHHAALPFAQVPGFVKTLRADEPTPGKLAFEFLILTATRTSEVLLATWDEIDLGEKLWTIPAARMKAKRIHRVPLSTRACEILETMKATTSGQGYVFPGAKRGKPLSNMAFLQFLRRNKLEITAHGFRSSFRDWAAETTSFAREVAEMALAHTVANKVEAAYRRGDLLDKRRELMQAWASYLGGS